MAVPNFAHWPNRLHVMTGRMPVTRARHCQRYDTSNIRVGTCADVEVLAGSCGLQVTDGFGLQAGRVVLPWPKLRAGVAAFKFEQV